MLEERRLDRANERKRIREQRQAKQLIARKDRLTSRKDEKAETMGDPDDNLAI